MDLNRVKQQQEMQQASVNDYASSDEEIRLPLEKLYIKKAYRRESSELNSIKMKKKLLLGQEQFKREEIRHLKIMLQDLKLKCESSVTTSLPITPTKPMCKKKIMYTLYDVKNSCFIRITTSTNRVKKFYLTTKKIVKEMTPIAKKFFGIVPHQLLEFFLTVQLEELLTKLLEVEDEKMKFKVVHNMYRNSFPKDGDHVLVEKTLCDIWCGRYNDNLDGSQSQLMVSQQESKITLDEIRNANGVWEIRKISEKEDMNVIYQLDKGFCSWSDAVELMHIKKTII